ncbi:MAG: hypothetical protein Kapaf2KO_06950 [Candidatus Kapaibacteriales bacterium]
MKLLLSIFLLHVILLVTTSHVLCCETLVVTLEENENIESPVLINNINSEKSFDYTEEIEIKWNSIDTADSYIVYVIDNKSQENIFSKMLKDTVINIGKFDKGFYDLGIITLTENHEISPYQKSIRPITITNEIPDIRYSECGKVLSQGERIEWNVEGFRSEYKLQISTNLEFTDGLYVPEYIMKPSYDFHSTELEPSTTYYWRVRGGNYFSSATSEQYESDWSETCSFTTDSWNSVSLINPADIKVRIEADKIYLDEIDPSSSLQILNMRGEILTTSVGRSIDKSNLSRGAYFLLINNEEMIKVVL